MKRSVNLARPIFSRGPEIDPVKSAQIVRSLTTSAVRYGFARKARNNSLAGRVAMIYGARRVSQGVCFSSQCEENASLADCSRYLKLPFSKANLPSNNQSLKGTKESFWITSFLCSTKLTQNGKARLTLARDYFLCCGLFFFGEGPGGFSQTHNHVGLAEA